MAGDPVIARVFYRPEIIEASGCVTVRFSPTRYVPQQRVAQNVLFCLIHSK